MPDPLADSTARLEQLLRQLRLDPYSEKADALVAEIWKILAERERIKEQIASSKPKP